MNDSLSLSSAGAIFICSFEKFSGKPYFATDAERAKGAATIGYGCTHYADGRAVKITDPSISVPHAIELFSVRVRQFEAAIRPMITVSLSQNEWDALVSLVFNIGSGNFATSHLLKFLNAGNRAAVADQFLVWNKQAGEVLPGLVRRRERERKMFLGASNV